MLDHNRLRLAAVQIWSALMTEGYVEVDENGISQLSAGLCVTKSRVYTLDFQG
jgi:hypothetical protein